VSKVQRALERGFGSKNGPASTHDLLPSEYRFVTAMQQIGFGSFESVPIQNGEMVLDPWPTTVEAVKFASEDLSTEKTPSGEFQLKRQVIEFLEYVRSTDAGEIRCLVIRHGLPHGMEVVHRPTSEGVRLG
jgi:hypothetical protein